MLKSLQQDHGEHWMNWKVNKNEYLTLKYGKIKLVVKKAESFVFYATYLADEFKDLKKRMIS